MLSRRITISGIVQGVGFRPFIYTLAKELSLYGQVYNTSAGVIIEVEGDDDNLLQFERRIISEKPALAQIDHYASEIAQPVGYSQFTILQSQEISGAFQPISPDVATCSDCLAELHNPLDRRYHYPFINCTNCGPRFTIIQDIPYDRAHTTMSTFPLCPECAQEYHEPTNRRFHAQPVACPQCGPRIWLEDLDGSKDLRDSTEILIQTQHLLRQGKILAIKGLAGFHLACDATNRRAVSELRKRKLRVNKPFALMVANLESVAEICQNDPSSFALLSSRQRPIVIMMGQPDCPIVPEVAPGQNTLGIMLPYTPLHSLLFDQLDEFPPPRFLVMTSGNLSEEPIVIDNEHARTQLRGLCDAFLMHDRPIHMRCDDSVVRVNPGGGLSHLRRARGYAPQPIRLSKSVPPLLATGAALKNTFALAREEYVFISHHIGDLENFETLNDYEQGIKHYEKLFRITPEYLAYDLHPDYLSSRYALARAEAENLPAFGIQHHHAHIAACMTEHKLPSDEIIVGLSFDGTGYGTDGAIWGGEILVASYQSFRRLAHFQYIPLPGGDAAIRRPARTALAHLWSAGVPWEDDLPCVKEFCPEDLLAIRSQLTHKINVVPTSSVGRLFDAAAAIAGVRQKVTYEAQAAIEFEAMVDPDENGCYPIHLPSLGIDQTIPIDPSPLIQALSTDVRKGIPVSRIAARFHNGLAELAVGCAVAAAKAASTRKVVLSGGVWQNDALLRKTMEKLKEHRLEVFLHHQVPANDGGIALGQVAVLAHSIVRQP